MITTATIGKVCIVGDGAHASISRTENGIPYLTSKNFKQEGLNLSNLSYISENDYEKHFREYSKALTRPKCDDLILSIIGSIGAPYLVRDSDKFGISSSVALIRPLKGLDAKYLFYYLKNSGVQNYVEVIKSGSAQGFLSLEMIKSIPIEYPLIETQQRIASILSAYDDLIEKNNARIQLLETTAQELYKEWFVRMRFPNFKNVKFVKGVPEGWEVKKLDELVTTQYGYTASAIKENVGLKFLRITDIADYKIDWENVPNCIIPEKEINKYLLKNGDIVVARTGATVGFAKRINKFHPPTVFASYLVRLKPKDLIFNYYLGIIIESENYKEYIQTVASGSAQPQANAGLMTGFTLFKPTDLLIKKFNLIVEPFFDQREILEQQNTHLRQIRDRLLPRLVSGKLAV